MTVADVDVAIVGGGPAGLTAAQALARAGASVAIVEESPTLGGQYFKRRLGVALVRDGDYRPEGTALLEAVIASGVQCLTGTFVWGTDGEALLTSRLADGAIGRLAARAVLLATGAYERSVPFPGWTLPGVCTAGCALHMATIDRVPVGRRVVVAGTGPFLLPTACALLEVGASVACVLELNRPYRLSTGAVRAVRHPARLAELGGYLARLHREGVPIRQGWRVLAATGSERVERVTTVPVGAAGTSSAEEIAVDALCVGYGFRPSAELAQLLGCACRIDPASGDLVPRTDAFGRTSRRTIFVAGEARGIAGVHAARVRGLLAAYAIAAELALPPPSQAAVRRARRSARRLEAFAALTGSLFPLPGLLYRAIPDDTVVCRCECVTAGEIRHAAAPTWHDIHAVKAATRAGMGVCQGRQCGNTMRALARPATGGESGAFRPRMPLKPIPYPTELIEIGGRAE